MTRKEILEFLQHPHPNDYTTWPPDEQGLYEILAPLLTRRHGENLVNWRYMHSLLATQRRHAYNICLKKLMNLGILKHRPTHYVGLDNDGIRDIPWQGWTFNYQGTLTKKEAIRFARFCDIYILDFKQVIAVDRVRSVWILERSAERPGHGEYLETMGYTERRKVAEAWKDALDGYNVADKSRNPAYTTSRCIAYQAPFIRTVEQTQRLSAQFDNVIHLEAEPRKCLAAGFK